MSGVFSWQLIFIAIFVPASVVLIWQKKRAERNAILAFDGNEIEYFKVIQPDWRCDRIIKRAAPLGWKAIKEDRSNRNQCLLVLQKQGSGSAPLSQLLMTLHKVGLACHPQRVDLQAEEITA